MKKIIAALIIGGMLAFVACSQSGQIAKYDRPMVEECL
jgi:hypothetical protein